MYGMPKVGIVVDLTNWMPLKNTSLPMNINISSLYWMRSHATCAEVMGALDVGKLA